MANHMILIIENKSHEDSFLPDKDLVTATQ